MDFLKTAWAHYVNKSALFILKNLSKMRGSLALSAEQLLVHTAVFEKCQTVLVTSTKLHRCVKAKLLFY